jgi:hypothetical protein
MDHRAVQKKSSVNSNPCQKKHKKKRWPPVVEIKTYLRLLIEERDEIEKEIQTIRNDIEFYRKHGAKSVYRFNYRAKRQIRSQQCSARKIVVVNSSKEI